MADRILGRIPDDVPIYHGPIEIVCHKGANEFAPENTFAAAQICIDWAMDYVEVDVNTSKDGVLYILHGPMVDHTTNGTGSFAELMSDEIDHLDAGSWFSPDFGGEKIPRLTPYLQWIKGKAKVFFDVKRADPKILIDLVYQLGMASDCFFWSGDSEWALAFRSLNRELQLKINVQTPEEAIEAHRRYRANIVEVRLEHMNRPLLNVCRQLGLKVMIYHPEKEPEVFRQVLQWGVDMVNVNYGDVFAKTARAFYSHRFPDTPS